MGIEDFNLEHCPQPVDVLVVEPHIGWAWVQYYCSWVGIRGHGYDIISNVT